MMVGAKGFEPSTLWSQTRCATRLRYAPTGDYCSGSNARFWPYAHFLRLIITGKPLKASCCAASKHEIQCNDVNSTRTTDLAGAG